MQQSLARVYTGCQVKYLWFYSTVSWWISWSPEYTADGGMRECCINVRAGTVKAFAGPGPWLPGICPDESWRAWKSAGTLHISVLPAHECVCACRQTCLRVLSFSSFRGVCSTGRAKVGLCSGLTDSGGWKLIQYQIQKASEDAHIQTNID